MSEPLFLNRTAAGKSLAKKLQHYSNRDDVLVLALARGGIPVAFEVNQALKIPIEIMIVRKLGLPGSEEISMGAIASGGIEIRNKELIEMLNIKSSVVDKIRDEQLQELERREKVYRGDLKWPRHNANHIVLIDDGLATGYSMRVAIEAVRNLDPEEIIVAVPVAPENTLQAISSLVDKTICLSTPEEFKAVSQWYDDFNQVTDEEVNHLLQVAWKH